MLIYNTTYTMPEADARQFVIWVHQCYIPKAQNEGTLRNARLLRILTHHEQDSECFSLQFEVEDTAQLHRWFVKVGKELEEEMQRIFDQRIVGFSTIMEVIEG